MSLDAFFLPAESGPRFCLLHSPPPGQAVRGGVVYVPPFAEELNCSRRLVALQARDFAAAGYLVLQIDLYGCGDSAGDFADTSWTLWQADLQLALDFLTARCGESLWLWGLRAGCLLAAQVASRRPEMINLLCWQPVLSGAPILRHFLRLKLAGELFGGGKPEGATVLRQRLGAGETLEIAGYQLAPQLAAELDAAVWPDTLSARRIECIEVSGSEQPLLSPLLAAQSTRWQSAGHAVHAAVVGGPAFWQAPGVSDVVSLRQASTLALGQGAA